MKKIYIIPSIEFENIEQENEILAGSPKIETGDLTGGEETGPSSGSNESTDNPEDMAKGVSFFDFEL